MSKPDGRPLLAVIATGPRLYREYLLRSIARRYRIHLISGTEPGWELRYIDDATVTPGMATAAIVAAVRALPAAGVMSWSEDHVVDAALAAESAGLPGPAPAAVVRCRDKAETRTALAAHGVPQPESILVGDVGQALAAADKLGYPVVVKPRAGVASLGTARVDDAAQLIDHFAPARGIPHADLPGLDQTVLVEEYLDGPEISVDAVVRGGRVSMVIVARKELGFPPYFEETGHVVSATDPLLSDPGLLRVLTEAHRAIGYADGWTHTELKLTAADPKVIEVNARLGGDLVPYLGLRASGVDPGLAAAAVACGEQPDLAPSAGSFAGIRFFYPPWFDTLIHSVDFDRSGLPAELDLLLPLVASGEVVSQPRRELMDGRIALATAVAATENACRSALDLAEGALRCAGEPRA